MRYIADLHIHSPFSRATSKASNLAGLYAWAQVKGINIVGTGDFTHPGWFKKLKDNLIPAEPGLFKLKNENVPLALDNITPENLTTRFVLTAEISSIYKRHDKVRKIHNILYVPDFESVEKINAKLAGIGNIESDGRPILGLDSRDLLEILLEEAPDGFLVPAHIWTPWFSLFGSKSGFDAIEDCFGDLTKHIFALETGLSSDPNMNRLISALDRFALISNSDCHSPSKLGRETNLFNTDFSYFGMRDALKSPLSDKFQGTIEFFPEEGKYHCDGHRKCQVCLEPQETRKLNSICPVCQRPLTVGVLHRVMELTDRTEPYYPEGSPEVYSLIPLPEVLSEIVGTGPATKGVMAQYSKTIARFGSEFNLLLNTPIEEINQFSTILGEAINRMRSGKVIRKPGFDGEFGVIRVFEEDELDELAGQISLFTGKKRKKKNPTQPKPLPLEKVNKPISASPTKEKKYNPEQEKIIYSTAPHILVTAGPGTGKTFTLVERLAHILTQGNTPAQSFTAITFTNRAADEVKERLTQKIGAQAEDVFVGTFHRFCLEWLRKDQPDLTVVGDETRNMILANIFAEMKRAELTKLRKELTEYCNNIACGRQRIENIPASTMPYFDELNRQQAIDLDLVIPFFVQKLSQDNTLRKKVCKAVDHLFVDEFQDLNKSQYELVQILAESAQVFAIGDPNQAIYGFRGSNLNFFYQFAKMPLVESLSLTRNYRSAQDIIEAATGVINNNQQKANAALKAESKQFATIEYYPAPTPQAEAEFIVRSIEEIMGGISHFSINTGRGGDNENSTEKSFGDIAVLYRLSHQADALKEALERRGIPFQLVGSKPFFMEPDIRVAYYWIKLANEEASIAEHIALLKELKGIGNTTIQQLEKSLPLNCPDFFDAISKLNISNNAQTKINSIRKELEKFKENIQKDSLARAITEAMSFLNIDLEKDNIKRFIELAGAFGNDLKAFSHHLEQNRNATVYDDRAEAVALMTLHAAKGLEFPAVFIAGLEENIIPCTMGNKPSDVEEERRLFYVAMTRAEEVLYLSSSASRTIFGKKTSQTVSRFVNEIPDSLLQKTKQTPQKRKKTVQQMTLF